MPKTPQDHKPKKPKMVHIDVQGIALDIDPVTLDDFELLDDLYMVEFGGMQAATRLPSLLRRFFGDQQHRKIMEHLRSKDTGRVSIEAGVEFVGDVFTALKTTG